MANKFLCYTDGSCKKNDNQSGGWGVVIKTSDGKVSEYFGGAIKTTSTAMELTAIKEALSLLPQAAKATVFSDSKSALDYCSRQIDIWKKSNWRNCQDQNIALLQEIDSLIVGKQLQIEWCWLRGHGSNKGNLRADELAAQGARSKTRVGS
jgi:ribonuclease HI